MITADLRLNCIGKLVSTILSDDKFYHLLKNYLTGSELYTVDLYHTIRKVRIIIWNM